MRGARKKFYTGLAAALVLCGQLVMPAQVALATSKAGSGASTTQASESDDRTITVCHRTDAGGNAYVEETIALPAAYNRYKNDVNGNVSVYPDANWGDIVPTFTYNDETISVNWIGANGQVDPDAQLVLDNHCDVSGIMNLPATYSISSVPCVEDTDETDTVKVTVTNTNDLNDKTVTYTVTIGTTSQQLTLAEGQSGTLTFDGLGAGTYPVTIVSSANGDGTNIIASVKVNECTEITEIPVPEVMPTDPCGLDNAYWQLPQSTDPRYTFSLEDGDLVVTAARGYEFTSYGEVYNYGEAEDSGKECPTIHPCESISGPTIVSSASQFADYQDTRTKGHYEFTPDGLRIYTDDNSSQAKVAWYHVVDYALANVGQPSMDYTATNGIAPGMQIALDKDGNGTPDGILVGEPAYYGSNWWSNADFGVGSGMGYTSYGTLDQYLAANPNAKVKAIGFSLGSGVLADGVLKSLTFGCHKWVFKKHVKAPCTVSSQTFTDKWGEGAYPETGAYPSGVPGTAIFKTDGLYLSTPQTESYVDGLMDAGNTLLTDIDAMSYKTLREITSTGGSQILPAYILLVDLDGDETTTDDQTYLFYEPIYNGTVQTGVWQTWNVLNGGNSTWWSFELSDGNPTLTWNDILAGYPGARALMYGFNQGTYNGGTNSAVQDITFDCGTTHFTIVPGNPGQGGGGCGCGQTTPPTTPPTPTPVPTPVVPANAEVPAELPHTGPANLTGIYGMILALLTYGVVYFAQPKRQEDL